MFFYFLKYINKSFQVGKEKNFLIFSFLTYQHQYHYLPHRVQGNFQDHMRKYVKVLYKEQTIKSAIGNTTFFPVEDEPA